MQGTCNNETTFIWLEKMLNDNIHVVLFFQCEIIQLPQSQNRILLGIAPGQMMHVHVGYFSLNRFI